MAWLIYIYQIKVNGFGFTEQVSGFHSGCISFKYGPPLCWGTLRILSKMLNLDTCMCDVCLMGLMSSWEDIWGGPGNLGKKNTGGRRCWSWLWQLVGLIRAKNTGWGVRRGLCIPLWMKGWGIEESWENTCISLFLGKTYMRFRK